MDVRLIDAVDADFLGLEPKPKNGSLISCKLPLMRDWSAALKEYLEKEYKTDEINKTVS